MTNTTTQFRTATGQTGTGAYIAEAAAIANSLRELNARAQRLADVIAREVAVGELTLTERDDKRPTRGRDRDVTVDVAIEAASGAFDKAVGASRLGLMLNAAADPARILYTDEARVIYPERNVDPVAKAIQDAAIDRVVEGR